MIYDIVIIGSGLGGLECAHILARRGMSVLVLERQVQPGGCMQSFARHSFHYDTGLHYIGGLLEGQRLHDDFERLNLLHLPWQHLDADGFDHITIGDRTFRFAEGYDRFVETLAHDFPNEREHLRRYVEMLQSEENIVDKGAWDYLNETFCDPLLVNVLAGSSLKMEVRKTSLPLFVFAHGNASYIESSWRLKGDGNQLVQSLTSDITSYGGTIVCKAVVTELIDHDSRIVAARCQNGETYEGRTFISDVHPAITCAMTKRLKPIYRRRMTNTENTRGALTVSLRLKPHALPYFNHNHFVYQEANVWEEPQEVDRVMVSCRVPEGDELQIDLMTPMAWEHCERWADTTVGHRGADYEEMKNLWADRCIALAERVIPNLGTMVAERHITTPLTWRDYTLTPQGSAYGMRKDWQSPLFCMHSVKTSIENLLLTGQSLILHGVEGVTKTAFMTCEALLN